MPEVRRRRWQQMGRQLHKCQNLLNRNFQAEAPNRKWVTDISYIQTKQGVLYLPIIRDLYDNSIVTYKTVAQQTMNLVLDTIRQAVRREKKKVPQSCSSTATRVFSILPKRNLTWLKNTALHHPCQDVGIRMTTQWQKICKRSIIPREG